MFFAQNQLPRISLLLTSAQSIRTWDHNTSSDLQPRFLSSSWWNVSWSSHTILWNKEMTLLNFTDFARNPIISPWFSQMNGPTASVSQWRIDFRGTGEFGGVGRWCLLDGCNISAISGHGIESSMRLDGASVWHGPHIHGDGSLPLLSRQKVHDIFDIMFWINNLIINLFSRWKTTNNTCILPSTSKL